MLKGFAAVCMSTSRSETDPKLVQKGQVSVQMGSLPAVTLPSGTITAP